MRNAVNKMTNLIDPYTENHFLSFIENLSDMELSVVLTLALSGCHWLRRPLHGSLHRSWVDAVYPTLKLICDFWPSKFSHYPSRPVPLPEDFVTTRPDPVPKSKTTTRQSLVTAAVSLFVNMLDVFLVGPKQRLTGCVFQLRDGIGSGSDKNFG